MSTASGISHKYTKILIVCYLLAPNILVKQGSNKLTKLRIPFTPTLKRQTNEQ